MNALLQQFRSVPPLSKRRSRRHRAVMEAIGNGTHLQDTQSVQRPATSPQMQGFDVALRKSSSKIGQRLNENMPSNAVPSELGSALAGFLVNVSPRRSILRTYGLKVTGARKAVTAGNDTGPVSAQVDGVSITTQVAAVRKLNKITGKRKRRAPVGELALVKSAAETEISLSQVKALCRPDHLSEVLGDLIETSPKAPPTILDPKKLWPSETTSASSTVQKSLSMIRKTIRLPQCPSHLLFYEGCNYKRLPATPRRSNLPARRWGSGFEGLENILPPKEPHPWPRKYRRSKRTRVEVPSLDFAEVKREREPRGLFQPAQSANSRSNPSTSTTSSDHISFGGERAERRLFKALEKDNTNVQPYDKSRYTAVLTHDRNPTDLPGVRQHSKATGSLIRPIIALHQNLQSSGNNEDLSTVRIDNQPHRQACRIRRSVTFEDEIRPQPPGSSSPPAQTSTTTNTTREIEAEDEESLRHDPSQPHKGDESDTDSSDEAEEDDSNSTTAIAPRYQQLSQLHERGFPTTRIMTSDVTSNATLESRARSGSDTESSDSLGSRGLVSSSKATIEREPQITVPGSDGRLSKVKDDIVDSYSPIPRAENHRAIRRGSLVLSTALRSSPPPSSDLQSPCRLRAETSRGAIRPRSEIPETQKPYERAASNPTPRGPLRSILKKGPSFGASHILRADSDEEDEEEEEKLEDMTLDQPMPAATLNPTRYFSQATQQLNSPNRRPDSIMPRMAKASPMRLSTSNVDEGGEEEEQPLPMTRRINITPNTSHRRSALLSDGGSGRDLRSLTRRMSRELGTTPDRTRRLPYIPFVPPFKTT